MGPVRNRARACAPGGLQGRIISNGMLFSRVSLASYAVALTFLMPLSANAANVFGGSVGAVVPCPFNFSTWASIGSPRGGLYIWTPGTHMYPRGLPKPGGYALGLYGIPYFCIVFPFPLIVFPGIAVVMSGTS